MHTVDADLAWVPSLGIKMLAMATSGAHSILCRVTALLARRGERGREGEEERGAGQPEQVARLPTSGQQCGKLEYVCGGSCQ